MTKIGYACLMVLAFGCTKINYTMPQPKTRVEGKVDTTFTKSVMQGLHSLSFSQLTNNNSTPTDTSSVQDQNLQIQVLGNVYSVLNPPLLPFFIPGGQGTFFFVSDTSSQILFTNVREFPKDTPPGFILNGVWNFTVDNGYILLSKENFYSSPQNVSYRTFSTFKISR